MTQYTMCERRKSDFLSSIIIGLAVTGLCSAVVENEGFTYEVLLYITVPTDIRFFPILLLLTIQLVILFY